MPNLSSSLAILVFCIVFSSSLSAADDFAGSPYQIRSYTISSVSSASLQLNETSPLIATNPYYLHLPYDDLTQSFQISFSISTLTGGPISDPPVISLYLPATYRIFWDDELIGYNGRFDQNGQEIQSGNSYRSFSLPRPTSQGSLHVLRIEGYHTLGNLNGHALIAVLQTISERLDTERANALTYALYIGFVLFGIYLLTYFYLDRSRIQFLLLGLTCITFGMYAVNKLLYYQLNVPYPYLDIIGLISRTIFISLSLLAPVTLLYILGFRRRLVFLFCLLPFAASSLLPDLEIIAATAFVLTAISLIALLQRRKHSTLALIVSLILLANYQIPYFAQRQAIGFGILAVYLLVSIINLQRRESKNRHQAQIRNTRLQLELLKSKIEPHFVLNSLTSAIEWIETNPRQGVKLIQALASEFELLSNISDKTEIPLTTEIESCRAYLSIMGFRKKACYQLELDSLDLDCSLPPSVIRNLLENAISHNDYGQAPVTFTLSQSHESGRRKFRFSAPLKTPEPPPSAPTDGTGIRYIKARLAESYATWSFTHGPKQGFWETEILVP